jgi:hypothetical protein
MPVNHLPDLPQPSCTVCITFWLLFFHFVISSPRKLFQSYFCFFFQFRETRSYRAFLLLMWTTPRPRFGILTAVLMKVRVLRDVGMLRRVKWQIVTDLSHEWTVFIVMAMQSNTGECSRTQAFYMPVPSQGLQRRKAEGFIAPNGTFSNVLVASTARIFKLKVTQTWGQGVIFFFFFIVFFFFCEL